MSEAREETGIRLSKEEINALPLVCYEGEVQIVSDDAQIDKIIKRLSREKFLGFDTETRPAFKKGQAYLPALLQLASADCVYIFQLQQLTHFDSLARLLEAASCLKCGVSLSFDIKELNKVFLFEAAGFIELSDLATVKGHAANGLRGLAASLLEIRISKAARTSNWERPDLTEAQLRYAATDAWVSREIYVKLMDL